MATQREVKDILKAAGAKIIITDKKQYEQFVSWAERDLSETNPLLGNDLGPYKGQIYCFEMPVVTLS